MHAETDDASADDAGESDPELLLCRGELAGISLPGLGRGDDRARCRLYASSYWAQHEAAIRASVAEAGVEPWAVTHRRPRGPRFDEWLRAFRGQHEY